MPITRSVLLLASILPTIVVSGQSMTSPELLNELHKLNTVGSVLYVAAHPDDENTAMLTYLAQEEKLETAYLSLTRGGGGQNLIGPELKEELGLIRANELLQARKIDGATQLFTRARDFGYSKNPEDTLENWREKEILGDVVYAIRYFQPDVIITRFNPDKGPTHGHHTVSAQLALRAFRLAADPDQFPEQLESVAPHRAKRIFWNGYGRRGGHPGNEKREVVTLEIGRYHPLLGTSYTEIAARSRSMHKSQGFGQAGRRGQQTEHLVLLDGDSAGGDFLARVDTTWNRYPKGDQLDEILSKALKAFDHNAPWNIVPDLVRADQAMDALPRTRQTQAKRATLHRLIAAAMGLHFEARSPGSYVTPGEAVTLRLELTNRSPVAARLQSVRASLFDSTHWPRDIELKHRDNLNLSLPENQSETVELAFAVPGNAPATQPFWLKLPPASGIYHLEHTRLLELESVPPSIEVAARIEVAGRTIHLKTPAIERLSDPVKGEVHHLVVIRPEVVLQPDTSILLFDNHRAKWMKVTVTSNSGTFGGKLVAEAPKGWKIRIREPVFSMTGRQPEQVIDVEVTPPEEASEGTIFFKVIGPDGKSFETQSHQIEYEHIGRQPILTRAKTKLTRLDLVRAGNRIACIEGVGDTVPETLQRIGYAVERITIEDINRTRLGDFDTVVLGPRVFDAIEGLDKKFDELLAYVEAGGTLISQFNTTGSRIKSQFSAPYPIQLSRDRVSEEAVEVRILQPNHPVFNIPNKIGPADFENWIQERGLYFASSWDKRYSALLSANDRGEPPRDGGLLVVPYGKGWYAYTGLSFFRQLPEGNPGAIRLFVNLISLGHEN